MTESRLLKVFLCYSPVDKPMVRELYEKLEGEDWIDPWLDCEKLSPQQDWDEEIKEAIQAADAIIVCLSEESVTRDGYVQKELRFTLDIALSRPEESVIVIALRLEKCAYPNGLRAFQYIDYFPEEQPELAYQRLLSGLKKRTDNLVAPPEQPFSAAKKVDTKPRPARILRKQKSILENRLQSFEIEIPDPVPNAGPKKGVEE